MNKRVIDGKEFYLVIYEYVLLDLPILGMKKDAAVSYTHLTLPTKA